MLEDFITLAKALVALTGISTIDDLQQWFDHYLKKILPYRAIHYGFIKINNVDEIYSLSSHRENLPQGYWDSIVDGKGLIRCEVLKRWVIENQPQWFLNKIEESSRWNDNQEGHKSCLNSYGIETILAYGFRCNNERICSYLSLYNVNPGYIKHYMLIMELVIPSLHKVLIRLNLNSSVGIATSATLTKRECEIIPWIQEGKSNWEISQILGISDKTVKTHIQNLFAKLEVNSRAQLAAKVSNTCN